MNHTQVKHLLQCFAKTGEPLYMDYARAHDHLHETSAEHREEIIAKITTMVVLCCASALCGSVPFLLNRYFEWTDSQTNARSGTVVKSLLYFGGGVLLATTFLHLLPEVRESVEGLESCGTIPHLSFPLAEILMCFGFFLMYFIEETIHLYVHHSSSKNRGAAFVRSQSIRNSHLFQKANPNSGVESNAPHLCIDHAGHMCGQVHQLSVKQDNDEDRQNPQNHHSHLSGDLSSDQSSVITSSLRGLFIVLALSIHELFEGMAIGLEHTATSVWFLFGAVSAHKLVLAFCVGVELIVARTRTVLAIIYILMFAIVSPLGIGIGILLSKDHEGAGPNLLTCILQGLACGTLLYVVFFEILTQNRAGILAYFTLFVGFLVMFGVQQLGAHIGHGHSHGSGCYAHHRGNDDYHDHEHKHDHDHDPDHKPQIGVLPQNQSPLSLIEQYPQLLQINKLEQQLSMLKQLTQKVLQSQGHDESNIT